MGLNHLAATHSLHRSPLLQMATAAMCTPVVQRPSVAKVSQAMRVAGARRLLRCRLSQWVTYTRRRLSPSPRCAPSPAAATSSVHRPPPHRCVGGTCSAVFLVLLSERLLVWGGVWCTLEMSGSKTASRHWPCPQHPQPTLRQQSGGRERPFLL